MKQASGPYWLAVLHPSESQYRQNVIDDSAGILVQFFLNVSMYAAQPLITAVTLDFGSKKPIRKSSS